ncbi:hypothetical protein B0H14DRAFT_3424784 [Mycena olivaceomarginata]|nr:hypothetical protein B0H14DRAFT_3424784 [Mycena olivaceomarginata]
MRSAPASRRTSSSKKKGVYKRPNDDEYATCRIVRDDINLILSNAHDMDVAVAQDTTSASQSKRKRVLSDEESTPIPAPVDAFNSLSSQVSKKPTKRVKIGSSKASVNTHIPAPVDTFNAQAGKPSSKVLEVTNVKRVKTLPKRCEVMDEALQDDMLKRVRPNNRVDAGNPELFLPPHQKIPSNLDYLMVHDLCDFIVLPLEPLCLIEG